MRDARRESVSFEAGDEWRECIGGRRRQCEAARRSRKRRGGEQRAFQRLEAFAALGDRRNHRHAKFVNQFRDVNANAFRFGHVELIERDDHGDAQLDDLTREEQVAFEMHGVDHDEDDVGLPVRRVLAHEHFECDLLVGRTGGQRVAAGKIEQGNPPAVIDAERSFDALYGHARKIADTLPKSGERVEERRLAGVRITDDGDAQRLGRRSRWRGYAGACGDGEWCVDRAHDCARIIAEGTLARPAEAVSRVRAAGP